MCPSPYRDTLAFSSKGETKQHGNNTYHLTRNKMSKALNYLESTSYLLAITPIGGKKSTHQSTLPITTRHVLIT